MKNALLCVGFELQYSPLQRGCVDNLAQALHPKMSKFTFDVIKEVQPGQEILILFSNKLSPTQQLGAKVTDCIPLAEDHFRISLITDTNSHVEIDNSDLVYIPITKGISAPIEMTLHCPACNSQTVFQFIANQDGDWQDGILPIYNCSSCGTTRAMIGLIKSHDSYKK